MQRNRKDSDLVRHVVSPGECLSRIARPLGVSWKKIWEHPRNSTLRELRGDPNILAPGDVVWVPRPQARRESVSTGSRHRFRRESASKLEFRLRMTFAGEPRAGLSCRFLIDGGMKGEITASTDEDGIVEIEIPADAKRAILEVGDGSEVHELSFGHLDPVEEVSGLQQRLSNLGFPCTVDGQLGPQTSEALLAFQSLAEIEATGKFDEASRLKLEEMHGS